MTAARQSDRALQFCDRYRQGIRLAIALCAALISPQVGRAEAAPDEIHWTITGQTSVTFDWRGAENTIRFGLTTAYGQTATASTPTPAPFSSAGPFWEARLTGLQEDTSYHYSIGGGPDHTFRTPPPRGSSEFTVFVAGDIGDATSNFGVAPLQATIAAGAPAFVLIVGDITYGNVHGQATVDHHFNDVMVWSQDAAYMPAWGNHEWDVPSADDLRNYKGRFDFPNPKTSPGSPSVSCCGEDWYWFDYGNVRFIAYPEPWVGAWSDWSTKAAAEMDAAQNDPAIKFIVTFGHRPAYSSGHHPGDSMLKGYLDGLGATHSKYVLNLNAHSHDYERTFPQSGVVHITAGTGGAPLQQDGSCLWLTCTKPAWSAYRAMHMGSLSLHFTATSIEGSFTCGPSGGGTNDVTCSQGSVIDAFVIGETGGAPVITAPGSVNGAPNVLITFTVTATDPEGDAITSLTGAPLPTGATFTANAANTSGTFDWTPTEAQTGNFSVTFTATNTLSRSVTTAITVTPPGVGPNLVGNPSFEYSSSGWIGNGGGIIQRVAGGYDGAFSLETQGPATGTALFGINDSPNWVTTTPAAGTVYRFTAWVRSATATGMGRLRVREYLGSVQNGATTYSTAVALTPDWQMVAVDYAATVANSTLDFQVLDAPAVAGEVFQADNVSIRIVSGGAVASVLERSSAVAPLAAVVAPNPLNPGATLAFTTSHVGACHLRIYDAAGRFVRTLLEERRMPAGRHVVPFDGRDAAGRRLAAGVYFYNLEAPNGSKEGRFVIMK